MSLPNSHGPDALFQQLIPPGAIAIGVGTSREVFDIPGHPDAVIKVAKNVNHANWVEMVVFAAVGEEEDPFLGQILAISQSGKYLIMERLNDLPMTEPLPDVPFWLTDLKRSAFGVSSSGAVKCRDYALLKMSTKNRRVVFRS